MLQALLTAKANPNARNRHGHTPLHFAEKAGQESAKRLLIERGADAGLLTAPRTPAEEAAFRLDSGQTVVMVEGGCAALRCAVHCCSAVRCCQASRPPYLQAAAAAPLT